MNKYRNLADFLYIYMCVVNVCTNGYEVLLRGRVKLDAKNIYTLGVAGRSWRERLGQEKMEGQGES